MNQAKGPIVLGVIVLIVLLLATSVQIVPPGNRGVRVTLGKVSKTVLGEGLAFKLPFGMTRVELVNVQQQTIDGSSDCFSSDLQKLTIGYSVLYRIPDDRVVELFQQYRGDPYNSLVEPRMQEAIKQVTATYEAEALVQNREKARDESIRKLRESVGSVVTIVDVNLKNIGLTPELENAIEAKMVQQQQALTKSFELDRERKEAEITLVKAQAEAEASQIRGQAFMANPLVLQSEIIKRWNGVSPTVVVLGSDAGSGANIILPLMPPSKPSTPTPPAR